MEKEQGEMETTSQLHSLQPQDVNPVEDSNASTGLMPFPRNASSKSGRGLSKSAKTTSKTAKRKSRKEHEAQPSEAQPSEVQPSIENQPGIFEPASPPTPPRRKIMRKSQLEDISESSMDQGLYEDNELGVEEEKVSIEDEIPAPALKEAECKDVAGGEGEEEESDEEIEAVVPNISNLSLPQILQIPACLTSFGLVHIRGCADCAKLTQSYYTKKTAAKPENARGKRKYPRLKPDEAKDTKCPLASSEYIIALWNQQEGKCWSCDNELSKTKFCLRLLNPSLCPSKSNFDALLCPICHALWQCVLFHKGRYDTYRELLIGQRPKHPFTYSVSCPVVTPGSALGRPRRVGESTYLPLKCKDIKKYQDVWWSQGGLACYHISQQQLDEFDAETRRIFLHKTKHCQAQFDSQVRSKRYWNFQSKMVVKVPLYRDANHLLTPVPDYFEKKYYTLIPTLFVRIQDMVGRGAWLRWVVRNVQFAPPPTESVEKSFLTPIEGVRYHRLMAKKLEKEQQRNKIATDGELFERYTEQHLEIAEITESLNAKKKEHAKLTPLVIERGLDAHEREQPRIVCGKHQTAWSVKFGNGVLRPLTKHHIQLTAYKVLSQRAQPDAEMYAQEIADAIYTRRRRGKPAFKLEAKPVEAAKV